MECRQRKVVLKRPNPPLFVSFCNDYIGSEKGQKLGLSFTFLQQKLRSFMGLISLGITMGGAVISAKIFTY
jgi:hypothetical protein